jgi:hypothetical protein
MNTRTLLKSVVGYTIVFSLSTAAFATSEHPADGTYIVTTVATNIKAERAGQPAPDLEQVCKQKYSSFLNQPVTITMVFNNGVLNSDLSKFEFQNTTYAPVDYTTLDNQFALWVGSKKVDPDHQLFSMQYVVSYFRQYPLQQGALSIHYAIDPKDTTTFNTWCRLTNY